MAFRRAFQDMMKQLEEASGNQQRTQPIFGEGEFIDRSAPEWRSGDGRKVIPESMTAEAMPDERLPRTPTSEEQFRPGTNQLTEAERAKRREDTMRKPGSHSNIGRPIADVIGTGRHRRRPDVLIALKTGAGVRQALVLSEIIGPPRSLKPFDER